MGEKTAIKLLRIANEIAEVNSSSTCEVLGNEKVLAKVPKDAKEDWASMSETLSQIHEVAQIPPLQLS